MSLSSNRNKRSKFKRQQPELTVQINEGYMVGLDFVSSISELYDKTESMYSNPNVIIQGNTVILDYSELSSIGRTKSNSNIIESDIQKLKVFFQATVTEGDTINIIDAEYLNELNGDTSIYDVGGSYKFKSFDVNNFIIILETISINNPSTTYDKYDKDKFINGSLKWTSSNSTTASQTEKTNEIVNRLGYNSKNSFRYILGTPKNNDILEIRVGDNSYSFTVKDYYKDENGEHIRVDEQVPDDVNLFSIPTFIILKRKQIPEATTKATTNQKKARILAKSSEKVHKMSNGKWMVGETHEEGLAIQKALNLVEKLNSESTNRNRGTMTDRGLTQECKEADLAYCNCMTSGPNSEMGYCWQCADEFNDIGSCDLCEMQEGMQEKMDKYDRIAQRLHNGTCAHCHGTMEGVCEFLEDLSGPDSGLSCKEKCLRDNWPGGGYVLRKELKCLCCNITCRNRAGYQTIKKCCPKAFET